SKACPNLCARPEGRTGGAASLAPADPQLLRLRAHVRSGNNPEAFRAEHFFTPLNWFSRPPFTGSRRVRLAWTQVDEQQAAPTGHTDASPARAPADGGRECACLFPAHETAAAAPRARTAAAPAPD